MKVLIEVPDDYVPEVLWDALEGLAASIRRLRRAKKLKKYQSEDLAAQLEDFAALRRTWQYYSVPSEWPKVDDISLGDED